MQNTRNGYGRPSTGRRNFSDNRNSQGSDSDSSSRGNYRGNSNNDSRGDSRNDSRTDYRNDSRSDSRGNSRNDSRGGFRGGSSRSGDSRGGGFRGGGFRGGGRGGPSRGGFGGNRGGGRRRFSSSSIDHSKYIKKIKVVLEEDKYIVTNNFSDFDLDPQLLQNIVDKKFTQPTPIQDQSIKIIQQGKDIIGLAGTGTGKTGAFLIPLINESIKDKNHRVIIVAPTRELAVQTHKEFMYLVRNTRVYATLCIGGESMYKQRQGLSKRPQFIIATPGRLLDHVRSNNLRVSDFQHIVLDEVDVMLDMGFIKDITTLMDMLPENRRSLFFSATLSRDIEKLTDRFLKNPTRVSVSAQNPSENVEQDVVFFSSKEDKFNKLNELLLAEEIKKVLVFVNTKHLSDDIKIRLNQNNIASDSIHGDKRQNERKRAILNFEDGRVSVLVATDVAARGLDIKNVTHVINYDEPYNFENYIHRIGRTGRAGKTGKALTFVSK